MSEPDLFMRRDANISHCRKYRYSLSREWDSTLPKACFIGLNPSTADALEDDPTIRRCIGFAKAWGFGGLIMVNLFAFRATKPPDMLKADDPIGPTNDETIARETSAAGIVIAAWGADGGHRGRDRAVIAALSVPLHAIGLTQHGMPRHPLYMAGTSMPTLYQPPTVE